MQLLIFFDSEHKHVDGLTDEDRKLTEKFIKYAEDSLYNQKIENKWSDKDRKLVVTELVKQIKQIGQVFLFVSQKYFQ